MFITRQSKKEREVGLVWVPDRLLVPLEEESLEVAHQLRPVPLHAQDAPLLERQHRGRPGHLLVLPDPLLPGLALVGGAWVSLDVVRVDVERDESERVEGGRVHDGHVVGGTDGLGGHVGAGGGADVGDALLHHPPPDGLHHPVVVERLQQPEGVAPADEDGLGLAHRLAGVAGAVDAAEGEAQGLEGLPGNALVAVHVRQRVGDEEDLFGPGPVQEVLDEALGVLQVPRRVQGGVGQEEEAAAGGHDCRANNMAKVRLNAQRESKYR